MKLAVLSDSHDNIWKMRAAIPMILTADAVLHCGDLCSPFMIKEMADPLGDLPIHIVWGNNEGDTFTIGKVAQAYPKVTLHGAMADIVIGDLRIALNHYPWIAEDLAKSGSYDLVCYGHDHQARDAWVEECLLLNPGELMGMNSPSSFTLVDVETRAIERVILE
jgi:putative phosphoesterase